MTRLPDAARAVPRDHYVAHARLGAVPQATAQAAMERDLRRACIKPGQTVLEIGTGTGLTGALLAELTGPSGHVVSADIDPALTRRVGELHAERHVRNITLVTGDALAHAVAEPGKARHEPLALQHAQSLAARLPCVPVLAAEAGD
jgi:protein-L-isoaspartate O-methyltransferase